MNRSNTNIFAASVGFLLGLVGTTGTGAAQAADVPTETVSYGDLDLSQPPDLRTLYHRLEAASARVCGWEPATIELSRHLVWSRCYRSALDSAVLKVNSRELQALNR